MAFSAVLSLLLFTLSLVAAYAIERRDSLSITVPPVTPNAASNVVDHGYMGLGFTTHTWPDYAGSSGHPNTFSQNLIQTIADRTGSPVHIRVGGTSGDYGSYVPDQAAPLVFPPGYVPGAAKNPRGITVGPSWFEGFGNFENVQWTYTAHLANNSDGMMQNSVQGVTQLLEYVGSNLESLEIGNEINFYSKEGARSSSYGATDYVADWNAYSAAIEQNALAGTQYANIPIWRALQFYNNVCKWCVSTSFKSGLSSSSNIMSAALHNYMYLGQKPGGFNRQHDFMNHVRVVSQLNQFHAPIAWLKANRPGIPFHLSEVNSATYCVESMRPYIGVFGSALWLVDYLLYGATINIARMNVQQSTTFAYSSWRPVAFNNLPPAVLPPYYAHPFVADVIGNSGNVRIFHINLDSATMSAYAVYDATSREVFRIVLVNLLDWTNSSGTPRPSTDVTLGVGSTFAGTVKVDKLTAPSSDTQDSSQITWKGTSWTYSSNGLPVQGTSDSTTVQASEGKFTVTIQASQALLLTLH